MRRNAWCRTKGWAGSIWEGHAAAVVAPCLGGFGEEMVGEDDGPARLLEGMNLQETGSSHCYGPFCNALKHRFPLCTSAGTCLGHTHL